jgi:hypothetical protein
MAYEPSEKAIEAAREAFGLLSNRAQMRAALIAAHEAEHPPPFRNRAITRPRARCSTRWQGRLLGLDRAPAGATFGLKVGD